MSISEQASTEYLHIVIELSNLVAEQQISSLMTRLEMIDDESTDLSSIFERDPTLLASPVRWIDSLRLVRFVLSLKNQITDEYDQFVQAYQELSTLTNPDKDQSKLLHEVGDLMYTTDDLAGIYERTIEKLMQNLSQNMKAAYAALGDPGEQILAGPIPDKTRLRMNPLFNELVTLAERIKDQAAITAALLRMRKLILGY